MEKENLLTLGVIWPRDTAQIADSTLSGIQEETRKNHVGLLVLPADHYEIIDDFITRGALQGVLLFREGDFVLPEGRFPVYYLSSFHSPEEGRQGVRSLLEKMVSSL